MDLGILYILYFYKGLACLFSVTVLCFFIIQGGIYKTVGGAQDKK